MPHYSKVMYAHQIYYLWTFIYMILLQCCIEYQNEINRWQRSDIL